MSTKNSRLRVAFLALVVGLAGLAAAGPAAAAAPAPTQQTATAAAVLTDFVDLPTSPLPAAAGQDEFTVTYRNETSADQIVAPQLLVESPDTGPFLELSDVVVEHRTASGCWEPVQLGSQTGTLYTDLSTAQRTLHAGETLTELYRVTVTNSEATGTVHPRVALYG